VTRPLILIADSSRVRRKRVMELCSEVGIAAVAEASSLDETYQLAELHRPKRVAIAADFARMAQFNALMDLLSYISSEVLLYGDRADHRANVFGVDPASAARHLQMAISDGINIQPQVSLSQQKQDTDPLRLSSCDQSLILIGASTGGIAALETILSSFPKNCPPTLIVQHIRSGFGDGLVRRLNDISRPNVVTARDNTPLRTGTVHIAAGIDRHLGVVRRGGLMTRVLDGQPVSGHCPSVDVLFDHGAAVATKVRIRAAILTGMGADGAAGMQKLRAHGGYTVAQDKASSVVWGMPRVAAESGAAVDVLPLSHIANALLLEKPKNTHLARSACP